MKSIAIWIVLASLGVCVALTDVARWKTVPGMPNIETISADSQKGDPMAPSRVEDLPPVIRSDAKRVRLYYGPFTVFGQKVSTLPHCSFRFILMLQKETPSANRGKMDPNGIEIDRPITGICASCTVLYAKADTHFLNSTRASVSSGLYNHHVLVLDSAKRTLPWYLCDEKKYLGATKAAGFIVTGVDEAANYFTSPDGKFNSGYWIGENQNKFVMKSELTNYRDHGIDVYVTLEVEYVPGRIEGWSDASVSLLSVTG
jgi:hypothetical protein